MVELETDDPRLMPEGMLAAAGRPDTAETLRMAVIDNLPKLTRLVCVLGSRQASIMLKTHVDTLREIGADQYVVKAAREETSH